MPNKKVDHPLLVSLCCYGFLLCLCWIYLPVRKCPIHGEWLRRASVPVTSRGGSLTGIDFSVQPWPYANFYAPNTARNIYDIPANACDWVRYCPPCRQATLEHLTPRGGYYPTWDLLPVDLGCSILLAVLSGGSMGLALGRWIKWIKDKKALAVAAP